MLRCSAGTCRDRCPMLEWDFSSGYRIFLDRMGWHRKHSCHQRPSDTPTPPPAIKIHVGLTNLSVTADKGITYTPGDPGAASQEIDWTTWKGQPLRRGHAACLLRHHRPAEHPALTSTLQNCYPPVARVGPSPSRRIVKPKPLDRSPEFDLAPLQYLARRSFRESVRLYWHANVDRRPGHGFRFNQDRSIQ